MKDYIFKAAVAAIKRVKEVEEVVKDFDESSSKIYRDLLVKAAQDDFKFINEAFAVLLADSDFPDEMKQGILNGKILKDQGGLTFENGKVSASFINQLVK